MNRLLTQELYQDNPRAACRLGLIDLAEAGGCSLGEVSKEWNFSGESLSGKCLLGGGPQTRIGRFIRLLIPTDMERMGLLRRQGAVCFGFSLACYNYWFENEHNQSNPNISDGISCRRTMEILS